MATTRTAIPTLKRVYLETEYEREGRNGRLYRGTLGWRWFPYHGADPVGDPDGYRTRNEAHREGLRILNR